MSNRLISALAVVDKVKIIREAFVKPLGIKEC
jgi:hypothetical protein